MFRDAGFYREIINTDGETYGGSNVGNMGGVQSEAGAWQARDHSILIQLPPLATVAFKWEDSRRFLLDRSSCVRKISPGSHLL